MKTIEELYEEVIVSEELKREFIALKPNEIEEFAKKNGCEATLEEISVYLSERAKVEGELSEDELDQVAGGKGVDYGEAFVSVALMGIGCVALAIKSAVSGNCGTAIEGDGMLCV